MRDFYSFLIVTGLVIASLAACSSCIHTAPKAPIPHVASETQRLAAVRIYVMCGYQGQVRQWRGSGTIVSKHRVLTAEHVTACPGNSAIFVQTVDGTLLQGKTLQANSMSDVSILYVEQALPDVPTPRIAKRPSLGEVVCSETATPNRSRRCGSVYLLLNRANSDIAHLGDTEGGNSGAGLYDSRGGLVGVVTRRNGDRTRGSATSLWQLRESFGL